MTRFHAQCIGAVMALGAWLVLALILSFAIANIRLVAACMIGGGIIKAGAYTARLHGLGVSFRAEVARHPILWRLVALSACAAFGVALPDIISFVEQVL